MKEDLPVIITNGNEPQVPYIIRLHESLRAAERGAYDGPFRVFTDHLPADAVGALEARSIAVHVFAPETVAEWENEIPSDHPLGKVAKFWFLREAARTLKHEGFTRILFLDPDILAQSAVQPVLTEIESERFLMAPQVQPMSTLVGGPVTRLLRAIRDGAVPADALVNPDLEINTGFIGSTPDFIETYASRYIDFVTSETFIKYARHDETGKHAWHDQDFFRAFVRVHGLDELKLVDEKTVVHLCNGAHKLMKTRRDTGILEFADSGEVPVLVHFAGHSDALIPYYAGFFDMNAIEGRRSSLRLRSPARSNRMKQFYRRTRRLGGAVLSEERFQRLMSNAGDGAQASAATQSNGLALWDAPRHTFKTRGELFRDVLAAHFGERPIHVLQVGAGNGSLMRSLLASDLYIPRYDLFLDTTKFDDTGGRVQQLIATFDEQGQRVIRCSAAELASQIEPVEVIVLSGPNSEAPEPDELAALGNALRKGGLLVVADYGGYRHPRVTKAVDRLLAEAARRYPRAGAQIRVHKNPATGAPEPVTTLYVERR